VNESKRYCLPNGANCAENLSVSLGQSELVSINSEHMYLADAHVFPDYSVVLPSIIVKGIVSRDWKGLQMVSFDRFEV
jgi:hypothetical protein